ncbi:PHD and RING finger domain-containing protein 1-like [Armigeres subalbatus]|uniref:PHD and RING finger domain-containing protein 1-like n=1 Tax=Armigeres subalbatus TaxID=124917 RepID=UPI002ED01230
MRMTRFSRGRPDYGGGGGRRGPPPSNGGRFRGGRGMSPPSRYPSRQQRRSSFEGPPSYRLGPPMQQHARTEHYPQTSGGGRHQPHHRMSEEFRGSYSHQAPQHSRPRREPHQQLTPHLIERARYPDHRYRSPIEMIAKSPSIEKEIKPRLPRERGRSPPLDRRRTKKRDRSLSAALSDISSGSSFFADVVDSDAYASPDYDELTSEEEEEIDEADEEGEEEEEEEEILEEIVKRKKRKKDKKKKERERKQRKKEKKRKKEILEERICPPEHDVAQSKEIFSSGKNILVSVSFADGDREDAAAAERAYRKAKKKKANRKKTKTESKHKDDRKKHDDSEEYPSTSQRKKRKVDENVKPVAIIDLERSPGKQLISSPKEVIVLSDEEGGNKKKSKPTNDLVGPNTPPEPAPKSPESYDPFEPTKSPTESPASGHNLGSISTVSYPEHHHQHHHHHHLHQRQPKDAQLAISQASVDLNSAVGDHYDDSILDLHPSSPMDQLSPRGPFRQSPLKAHRPSPMKKSSHATATITSGALAPGTTATGLQAFGEDMDDGDISPYSPRSSDCDDHMFDPPPEGSSANGSQQQPKTIALTVDNLRKVFGNDKKTLYGDLRRPNEAVLVVDEMYKPQRVTMEMLDEMPNSAVDLQIKEKLIQKLQRQERIIEEVKHFLKPHFNKKRINKDEYKDIMKKSVPKICHSRSGEINPVKVQNLIAAYVKKAIAKRRIAGHSGNAIVSSTTAVT